MHRVNRRLFLDTQFFPLIPVSVFVPGPLCLDCYSSIVSEVGSTTPLALFFKIVLNLLHVYVLHFKISLPTFVQRTLLGYSTLGNCYFCFCM